MTENALQTKYLRFINGRALNVIPDITVDLGHGLVNLRIFLVRLAHEGVLGTHRGCSADTELLPEIHVVSENRCVTKNFLLAECMMRSTFVREG